MDVQLGCGMGCLLFPVMIAVGPAAAVGQSPPAETKSPPAKLADLVWIQGAWQTELGSDQLEEYWSAPLGDSMVGMFRWVKGGKLWMCEVITIVADADRTIFRLKHFDRQLVGWEEKAEAITLPLVRASSNEIVFEDPQGKNVKQFTYRAEGKDTMLVRLEIDRDGKPDVKEFHFRRMAKPDAP